MLKKMGEPFTQGYFSNLRFENPLSEDVGPGKRYVMTNGIEATYSVTNAVNTHSQLSGPRFLQINAHIDPVFVICLGLSILFSIFLISFFIAGLKHRRNDKMLAVYSSLCLKCAILSLVLNGLLACRELTYPFIRMATTEFTPPILAMSTCDVAIIFRLFLLFSPVGLIGIIASIILDIIRRNQINKTEEGQSPTLS